jgi:hypothetical protein
MALWLLLAFCCISSVIGDQRVDATDVYVDLMGSSGMMRLSYGASKKDTTTIQLNWVKLVEYNTANGQEDVLMNSAPNINWVVTPSGPYNAKGTILFSNNRQLDVYVYLSHSGGEVPVWGAGTVSVPAGELKFTLVLNTTDGLNWYWRYGANGMIRWGLDVACHSDDKEKGAERAQERDGTESMLRNSFSISTRATVRVASTAVKDGVVATLGDNDVKYSQRATHMYRVMFTLPRFTKDLVYDPAAAFGALNLPLIIGCSVGAFVLLCLVGWCVCRRRRAHTSLK